MTVVDDEWAMARALALARRGPTGENPRVGCVVLDRRGEVVGEGWHEGAGTAHAEVVALAAAGVRARGGAAVVTLEPCAHQGRTPPCTDALIDAGVARVRFGCRDLHPVAAGGAMILTSAGVEVAEIVDPTLAAGAAELVERWSSATRLGRPFVTWKLAVTLDGRSAAADGSSRWITGPPARADAHRLRAECDTVLVGSGTVRVDDPHLTVRDADGVPVSRQPRRAVMGTSPIPAGAQVLAGTPATWLATRDPVEALARLWAEGARHVLLEGGPTLAAAFVRSGRVDEVVAYLAPAMLGAGASAVADLGIASIDGALRLELRDVTVLGDDVRLTMRPRSAEHDHTDARPGDPSP